MKNEGTAAEGGWGANKRGALAMSGAMALFIVNDSMIKLASESVPAAQAIGVRGLFATLWVFLAVWASGLLNRLPAMAEPRTAGRALFDVVGTFTYLLALFNLPLADATAINMAAPLFVVVLAVFMLREQVHWRRWTAVLVGFAGALLIVKPGGAAFTWWAALCLGATFLHSLRDVYTRRIPRTVPSLIITLATAIAVTVFALGLALAEGWKPMETRALLLLAGASTFLAGGYHLVIVAMRSGDASVVGAFRYSALPAAAALGWFLWGHVPDAISLFGMALLVGAGLYIMHRERVRSRSGSSR